MECKKNKRSENKEMSAFSNSDNNRAIEKLNGDNFHIWKFKMQMVLEEKDLWDIVTGDEPRPSQLDAKAGASVAETISYDKRAKKAFTIICLSVQDSQLGVVRSAKSAQEAWRKLVQHYEMKGLAHKLFLRRKFFTVQMVEGEDLTLHINKVKTLAEQLEAIGAPVSEEDIVMTLLCSLPETYHNLIVALESRTDNLDLEFVTARLMHEELKRKEIAAATAAGSSSGGLESAFYSKPQRPNRAAVPGPSKAKSGNCNFCGKPGHWARDCRKRLEQQHRNVEEAHQAFEPQEHLFAATGSAACKQFWYVDSGASQHLTPRRDWFSDYKSIPPKQVFMGDDHPQLAIGVGSIRVQLEVDGEVIRGRFMDVLHVPGIANNLLSVSKMVSQGMSVQFEAGTCLIRNKAGKVVGKGVHDRNLYKLVTSALPECAHVAASALPAVQLWHERLGHSGIQSLHKLRHMVHGMENLEQASLMEVCKACMQGKQQRNAFPKESTSSTRHVLELVHSDICGPMQTATFGGCRYFMTFIDDKSRKVFVHFLKSKDEALAKFQMFQAMAEKATGKCIKMLRTDNGGEFMSKAFTAFLESQGILHQTTAPYSPQQNGVAERANRTLVESARSMLHARNMAYEFWGEAVSTAAYLRNRNCTKAIKDMTPEEAWSGSKPDVSHLRIFGTRAFVHVPKERRSKLDPKTMQCIMVGYCEGSKAYRLYHPDSHKIIKSRDVVFDETKSNASEHPADAPSDIVEAIPDAVSEEEEEHTSSDGDGVSDQEKMSSSVHSTTGMQETTSGDVPGSAASTAAAQPRRSARVRQAPGQWWNASGSRHQANIAACSEPQSMAEALAGPDAEQWEQAMDAEHESILKNNTWKLTSLPPDRKAIGCKWVFKVKSNADGSVARYKARLVAKGYAQTYGIDYNETFAPVAKFNSIRTILAIAAMEDFEVHQMDVKTAFLNGDLEDEIYMKQPEGYVQPGQEHLVCKLQKTLYGLKQSPRAWYQKIDRYFTSAGFIKSNADHSLYVRLEGEAKVIIALYVDDLILISNRLNELKAVKSNLAAAFKKIDLGEIHYCLGIQVLRDRANRAVTLGQGKYVQDIRKRFGMEDCKPRSTPLDANSKLTKDMAPKSAAELKDMEGIPYQQAVGSLMYAMVATRPDIAYAVGAVSQFMSNPGSAHWMAVKRVLRYLQGTSQHVLRYGGECNIVLAGYCDADWAGNVDDRRSTTGFTFMLGGGSVCWNSKKQATVALSTTEAEYIAAAQATKEAVWMRQLLADLGYEQVHPTIIHDDNQGCLALIRNPAFHNRTKHIDIQHHFIREKVEKQEVELKFCSTQDMVADILTKGLTKMKHGQFRERLGLHEQ
jgi:transposase InsO family protein